jgi:hypothetical protein
MNAIMKKYLQTVYICDCCGTIALKGQTRGWCKVGKLHLCEDCMISDDHDNELFFLVNANKKVDVI